MSSPMDRLFDQGDWICTKCGTPMAVGCACWHRTTADEKQAVATAVRTRVEALLRTQYPPLSHSSSARTSLPQALFNHVEGQLRRLDRDAPRGYGLQAADVQELVADICLSWGAYVRLMCDEVLQGLDDHERQALAQAVEALVAEELGTLVHRRYQ